MKISSFIIALGLLLSGPSMAKTFIINPNSDVIGKNQWVHPKPGENLADVGRRHGIGYYEMVNANRHLSTTYRLSSAAKVFVPGKFLIPPGPRQGIVINLAELRLFYFPKGRNVVITHPIGIGRENGWETPTGTTRVIAKKKDPTWRPTARVRRESAANGYPLPKVFPPGPDNPLGKYMLRLAWATYLIHGTNQVQSIGGRVSAGCIRLLPDGIRELYHKVPVGTQVRVVNQPVKVGWHHGRLIFEAHPNLIEQKRVYESKYIAQLKTWIKTQVQGHRISMNWGKMYEAMSKQTGVPEVIGM